jgi:2-dehydro-3-deoxygalactonokinase
VLETRSLSLGVLKVSGTTRRNLPEERSRAFEHALCAACLDWLDAAPNAPVIASGMVGSNMGWCEIPHLPVPVDFRRLATALGRVETTQGRLVYVVPGLIEHSTPPNVMRDEETQVVGAVTTGLADLSRAPSGQCRTEESVLIGAPGTHSKWAYVKGTTIEHFETFMTGELYEALCKHTILGRTMRDTGTHFDHFQSSDACP